MTVQTTQPRALPCGMCGLVDTHTMRCVIVRARQYVSALGAQRVPPALVRILDGVDLAEPQPAEILPNPADVDYQALYQGAVAREQDEHDRRVAAEARMVRAALALQGELADCSCGGCKDRAERSATGGE